MIEYALSAFQSVYICKLLHHYGKLNGLGAGWVLDEDLYWSMQYEALEYVCDKVWVESYDMENKYYFSDKAMMEYYRLCREYSRQYGMSLNQNPYILNALAYTSRMLDLMSYGYRWTLHTGINHKWASGIVIGVDDTFDGYRELLETLLEIFWFYEKELKALKSDLSKQNNENTGKEAA